MNDEMQIEVERDEITKVKLQFNFLLKYILGRTYFCPNAVFPQILLFEY
jgi:hypothetical protein